MLRARGNKQGTNYENYIEATERNPKDDGDADIQGFPSSSYHCAVDSQLFWEDGKLTSSDKWKLWIVSKIICN
jgi:hypothetical protein